MSEGFQNAAPSSVAPVEARNIFWQQLLPCRLHSKSLLRFLCDEDPMPVVSSFYELICFTRLKVPLDGISWIWVVLLTKVRGDRVLLNPGTKLVGMCS